MPRERWTRAAALVPFLAAHARRLGVLEQQRGAISRPHADAAVEARPPGQAVLRSGAALPFCGPFLNRRQTDTCNCGVARPKWRTETVVAGAPTEQLKDLSTSACLGRADRGKEYRQ